MQSTAEHAWEFPNRMEALPVLSREVLDWLSALPLSTRAKYAALLSVEEMVTNIIKYGYDDDREHAIRLRVVADRNHVKLVF